MAKRINYIRGQILNNGISYLEERHQQGTHRFALLKCHCGETFISEIASIKSGNVKYCGCNRHGDSHNHYLYKIWNAMKRRCLNPNVENFKYYGGRGIKIFKEWIHNYPLFKNDILSLIGDRPIGSTLDRKANNGDYEPGNVGWSTYSEQCLNRRPKKLKNEDVLEIRWLLSLGAYFQREIADDFNVSNISISDIKTNRTHSTIQL